MKTTIRVYIARVSNSETEDWDYILGVYKNIYDAEIALESYFREKFNLLPDEDYNPRDFDTAGYYSKITPSVLL